MSALTVEPFKAAHVAEMAVQPAQRADWENVTPDMLRAFEQTDAWTVRVEGEVVLVGGLVEVWAGRATLWSYVAAGAGPHMVRLTKGVRRFIDGSAHRRIEMYVDVGFAAAHRWARALGFQMEAERMASFFPDGRNAALYGRIR
jgi:hypothetical protein